jgi:hypothetical protein
VNVGADIEPAVPVLFIIELPVEIVTGPAVEGAEIFKI